ncbi:hypothetical protein KGMB01110_26590 [Mediterraneibacter butyricigenes]|uniref:DUF1836 domain-containing protein n=1 Tax=Mediterraneibacter butyricigenes TaxID=2316025 RepID=A0A391PEW0_9FIRM|nr:DUF1836 domain-containing protein [Mediterraneibacter butyricigenes]RGO28458.1 DUF1836 domain-containing protein [Dorea sp. OM02-2LB]RGV98694.1 DUF1836 domain-containing protein [Ruminococcus sp. AF14-10]GCA68223.1 hypothetical protein KGMB01110_26590 [Mediterraneibacter butyricigenes]
MKIDSKDLLNSILESLDHLNYIPLDEIPNIDLYMDQVTTFMEKGLSPTKRYEEDKILTKTMINNYAKNNLLPPPLKKKYSREHMIVLIFIYYFKNILSIRDIEQLLQPLTEKHFHTDAPLQIDQIYQEVCELEKMQIPDLKEELQKIYQKSEESFSDAPDEYREDLKTFSFICSLSFDIYLKKMIVERLLDDLSDSTSK